MTSTRPSRILDPQAPQPIHDDGAGFPATVAQVAGRMSAAATDTAALECGLTFAGRIPLWIGRRSLTSPQRALYAALRAATKPACTPRAETVVGMRVDGRILLLEPWAFGTAARPMPPSSGAQRRLTLDEAQYAAYEAALKEERRAADVDWAVVARWLETQPRSRVVEILDALQQAFARMPPVMLLVEEELYSNFRFENNLTGKTLLPTSEDCVLRQLARTPTEDWSREDATFVYCGNLALATGSPTLESFNYTQFVPRELAGHFRERARTYSRHGILAAEELPTDLKTAAGVLARARERALASLQSYRHIWGITLHKREEFLPRTRVDRALVELARACEGRTFAGLRLHADLGRFTDEVREWLPEVLANRVPLADGFTNAVEQLLAELMDMHVERQRADVALTRSIRSLSELAQAVRREDWAEIVSWELPAFFCYASASEQLCNEYAHDPARLADMRWEIAARMEYNCWHQLPGNLPRAPVVEQRDYYIPPWQPDIAEWSDQHHRGHTMCRIRFSVRSPMAVEVAGRQFNALADVRLVRQDGPSFDEGALTASVALSRLVARVLEELAAEVVRRQMDFRIQAFTPAWYAERAASGRVRPEAVRERKARPRRRPVPVA